MRKAMVWGLAIVGVLMAAPGGIASASTTPRWVRHVQSNSGGISNRVRAYLTTGVSSPEPGPGPVSSTWASRAPLNNLQVNSLASTPPVPQNETQVVVNPRNPLIAVAAANDYVNGGSQIYRT